MKGEGKSDLHYSSLISTRGMDHEDGESVTLSILHLVKSTAPSRWSYLVLTKEIALLTDDLDFS